MSVILIDLHWQNEKAEYEMPLFEIEFRSQRILNLMRKGFKLDDVKKTVKMCKDASVKIEESFIISFPTKMHEEAIKKIEFVKQLKPDKVYHRHSFFHSTEISNSPNKWETKFRHLIDCRKFDIDKPLPCTVSKIKNNLRLIIDIIDRHMVTFLIKNSCKISKNIDIFLYEFGLKISEAHKLIKKAVQETLSTRLSVSMDEKYKILRGGYYEE